MTAADSFRCYLVIDGAMETQNSESEDLERHMLSPNYGNYDMREHSFSPNPNETPMEFSSSSNALARRCVVVA